MGLQYLFHINKEIPIMIVNWQLHLSILAFSIMATRINVFAL